MRAWKYASLKPMKSSATGLKDQGRYVATRANERGERHWREPVNEFGVLETQDSFKDWAEEQADRGRIAHALTMNPGEGSVEKRDLETWARATLERLEFEHSEPIEYQLWVHDDHTRHAHVHAIVTTERPISEEVARELRFQAGAAWQELQAFKRDVETERSEDAIWESQRVRLEARTAQPVEDRQLDEAEEAVVQNLDHPRLRPEIDLER